MDDFKIGTDVILPDGRFGSIQDLYYKHSDCLAQVETYDGSVVLHVPVEELQLGFHRKI
jgi:hypothetical protein